MMSARLLSARAHRPQLRLALDEHGLQRGPLRRVDEASVAHGRGELD
jgi:hypothetical protein